LIAIEKSISGFLKLEPLIANRSDSAAVSYSLDGFDLSRPSNAAADSVNCEASVRSSPQPLMQKPSTRLIDVIINARIIDTCADDPSDCGANVLND
jgi:hypothetical protein